MTDSFKHTAAPNKNHLLAALNDDSKSRIYPNLELITMSLGMVIYESGDKLSHVYFPTDCIVSLIYEMEDGATAEIVVVGNEGMLGVAVLTGGESTPAGRLFKVQVTLTVLLAS